MSNKSITIKAMFNHYLRNFPPIIADQAEKFDQLVNYFFPDILKTFLVDISEAELGNSPDEGPTIED